MGEELRAVAELIAHAPKDERCSCETGRVSFKSSSLGKEMRAAADEVVKADTPGARRRGRGSHADDGSREKSRGRQARFLWAYELEPVAAAYRWLIRHRSASYPKCCDAVLVYQIERSRSLPPGLYVYRSRPSHFGCSKQRPLTVVDQFNFVADRRPTLKQKPGDGRLPDAITIDARSGAGQFQRPVRDRPQDRAARARVREQAVRRGRGARPDRPGFLREGDLLRAPPSGHADRASVV
ncbi:hypothetical protein Q5P01_021950 [Channa striata]|uniref:Uncharacterized protein n=1 Tax=Channa striata TaxID=64152 RepID=A0AA88IVD4_CHASR|nr:hypothetical protein Q5P01_021950 [Channa striata]